MIGENEQKKMIQDVEKELCRGLNMVRLNVDISENEYALLKTGCTKARVSIQDFMYEMVLKGIQELEEERLQKKLKLSIQQSKAGKVQNRGSFAQYVEDEV